MKTIIIILIFSSNLIFTRAAAQEYQWVEKTNPRAVDGKALIKLDSNNHLVVFTQYSTSAYHYIGIDYTLLSKYDLNGTLIFQDTLKNAHIGDFSIGSDNSIYLTGYLVNDTVARIANLMVKQNYFLVRYISPTNAILIPHFFSGNVHESTSGICRSQKLNEMIFVKTCSDSINPVSFSLLKYNPGYGYTMNKRILNAFGCFTPQTDSLKNIYLIGAVRGAANFGVTTLNGNDSNFLAKCDSNFNFNWAKLIPRSYIQSFSVDPSGNIYIAGGGYSANTFDSFVYKYDTNGQEQWQKTFANSGATDIYADQSRNIYVTGGLTSYDGTPQFENYSLSGFGMYIVKLNSNDGSIIWLKTETNDNQEKSPIARTVFSDGHGYVYVGGGYKDTTSFGNTTLYGGPAGFIAKLSDNTSVNVKDFKPFIIVSIFPNPSSGIFTIQYSNAGFKRLNLTVKNVLGQSVFNNTYESFNGSLNEIIDLSKEGKGIYFFTVRAGDAEETQKVIIQ